MQTLYDGRSRRFSIQDNGHSAEFSNWGQYAAHCIQRRICPMIVLYTTAMDEIVDIRAKNNKLMQEVADSK